MKKELIDFKVDYRFDWEYGVEISKMKKDLEELEKLGVNRIEIEAYQEYDSSYLRIEAISRREETEKERINRINKQKEREEECKRRDLAQLAILKEKYGDK